LLEALLHKIHKKAVRTDANEKECFPL
jgi:hypothetical protein